MQKCILDHLFLKHGMAMIHRFSLSDTPQQIKQQQSNFDGAEKIWDTIYLTMSAIIYKTFSVYLYTYNR